LVAHVLFGAKSTGLADWAKFEEDTEGADNWAKF
jgi:hypothetical protein